MNYERETDDFQPVIIRINGEAVTSGVTLAVWPAGGPRPIPDDAFVAPMALAGQIGVRVTDLAPGEWNIFAKVDDQPLTPVFKCGRIRIN